MVPPNTANCRQFSVNFLAAGRVRDQETFCVSVHCCQRGVARAPAIRSQTPECSLMTNKHRKVASKPTLGRQNELAHHCDESMLSTVISRCHERLVKGVIFWKGQGNFRRTARMVAMMAWAPSRNYMEGRSGALEPCGRGIRHSPAPERWPGWMTASAGCRQRLALRTQRTSKSDAKRGSGDKNRTPYFP